MASEKPLPDRCGARVVTKTGLEISLANGTSITDETIAAVRLASADGQTTIDAPASYESVREYLWDDYTVTLVAVPGTVDQPVGSDIDCVETPDAPTSTTDNPVTHDKDTHTWLAIGPHVTGVTNHETELEGFCERYPMRDTDHGRCYVHQGSDGPPDGNTNAMTHGIYAQRTNFYQALDNEDKQFIEAMVDSWIEQAPFDRDNVGMVNDLYRCAIDQVRAWAGIDEFVEDGTIEGLVKEQEIFDGEEVHEIEDEHPANLPYSRLDNDVRSKLKDIGVYDSPEQQQAEATESLAKKLSGLSDSE